MNVTTPARVPLGRVLALGGLSSFGPLALDLIDALQARGGLDGYEMLPAVRADLLRRLGRHQAAREAYLAATAATQLEPLRRLYARRLAELDC